MCVLFVIIAAQLTPHGQLDIIKLRFPQKAIPGSVGAVIYLTGESIVTLFYANLNLRAVRQINKLVFFFESTVFCSFQPKHIFVPYDISHGKI